MVGLRARFPDPRAQERCGRRDGDSRDEGLRSPERDEGCRCGAVVNAVNADGSFGRWHYRLVEKVPDITSVLSDVSGVGG